MDTWRDISAALPGRPRWQLVGFAAGCGQRLVLVVAGLGGPAVADMGAVDLLGQVDFLLARPPTRSLMIIEPDEAMEDPPGPLVAKEIEAQRTSIALLEMGDRPQRQAIAAVQQLSRAWAAELSKVIPGFARRWAAPASGT